MAKKSCDVKERAFAEMIADYTDSRSITKKCQAAGWKNGNMAWEIMKRPHVADEIDRLVENNLRAIRSGRGAVMAALLRRASGNGKEANEAAKIYLQATGDIGTGGVTNVNNVTANAEGRGEDSLSERLEAVTALRRKRLVSGN